jgi:hypothetical protein
MKSFRLVTPTQHKMETLKILRGFIADLGNMRNGVELIRREKEIVDILENEMEILTAEERYKVYGFMEGIFPKRFKQILTIRLKNETDSKCLEVLRAISDIHSNEAI